MAVAFPTRRHSSRVEDFNVTPVVFLQNNPQYDCVAVGALVMFGVTPNTRALISKRDTAVALPGKWEVPSGPCDDPNLTILATLNRILLEETHLQIEFIADLAGVETFDIQTGKRVRKFTFIVQAQDGIPATLQKYQAWDLVSLDEAFQAQSVNFGLLTFTSASQREIILNGFSKYDEILSFRSWCRGGTI